MSSTYLSLNRQVESNRFLKIINDLITKHGDIKDCILKVEILKIAREDNGMILKLEDKRNEHRNQ
jgi:hypothetical protein